MAQHIIRLEKWGSTYRLVKFYGSGLPERERSQRQRKEDEQQEVSERERDERFEQSVQRSRSRVRELALCNPWEFFATFTLSDEKCDRFDLNAYIKALGVWIGNYNKKYHTHLKYLIIPEQHKNGAWHAHGLLSGVTPESLCKNEHGYLDMPYYRNRFGYISLSHIKDAQRCATYVSKYITKDTKSTADALGANAHSFYSSRGLQGKEILWQGLHDDVECDWYNDFVGIKYLDEREVKNFVPCEVQ